MPANGPLGEVEKLVKTVQKNDPALSDSDAVAKVLEQRPELYEQYENEQRNNS